MLGLRLSDEALTRMTACMLTPAMVISASEGRAQPATTLASFPVTYVAQGWSTASDATDHGPGIAHDPMRFTNPMLWRFVRQHLDSEDSGLG
jgi:hypothetical protein